MRQKSSVPQAVSFVSQVLKRDRVDEKVRQRYSLMMTPKMILCSASGLFCHRGAIIKLMIWTYFLTKPAFARLRR